MSANKYTFCRWWILNGWISDPHCIVRLSLIIKLLYSNHLNTEQLNTGFTVPVPACRSVWPPLCTFASRSCRTGTRLRSGYDLPPTCRSWTGAGPDCSQSPEEICTKPGIRFYWHLAPGRSTSLVKSEFMDWPWLFMRPHVVPMIRARGKLPPLRYYTMQISKPGQENILARAESYYILLCTNSQNTQTEFL